jgi:hypothetical protein
MKIEYYFKNVFGHEMIYIKDQEIAARITAMTNRLTINKTDIKALGFLGHEMIEVLPPHN